MVGNNSKKTEKKRGVVFIPRHERGTLATRDGARHSNNYVTDCSSFWCPSQTNRVLTVLFSIKSTSLA